MVARCYHHPDTCPESRRSVGARRWVAGTVRDVLYWTGEYKMAAGNYDAVATQGRLSSLIETSPVLLFSLST
jgi:hypothetical protein